MFRVFRRPTARQASARRRSALALDMTPQTGPDKSTVVIRLGFGGLIVAFLGGVVIVEFYVTAPVGGMIAVLLTTVVTFAILGNLLGDRMYHALGRVLRWFP